MGTTAPRHELRRAFRVDVIWADDEIRRPGTVVFEVANLLENVGVFLTEGRRPVEVFLKERVDDSSDVLPCLTSFWNRQSENVDRALRLWILDLEFDGPRGFRLDHVKAFMDSNIAIDGLLVVSSHAGEAAVQRTLGNLGIQWPDKAEKRACQVTPPIIKAIARKPMIDELKAVISGLVDRHAVPGAVDA